MMNEMKWSKAEKASARRAFDMAYRRECEAISAKLKEMIEGAKEPDDLWRIHDYLNAQRKNINEKYDFRYSVLLFVMARLLTEGWLTEMDLDGLGEDKIEKIKYLTEL
jgi:hypothetical protein